MALPGISWLLLSLIFAVTPPVPCTCEAQARMAGNFLRCYPASAVTNFTNGTAFRESLLPLLSALPSAAAPTGFASLRSHPAFVRGLCFGDATVPSSECLLCLSAAAMNITAGCGATSRRASIWTSGCFLAYAGTETSSPSEDASRELLLLPGSGDHGDTDTSSPSEDASRELLLLPGSGDHGDTDDTSSPSEDASREVLLLWGSGSGDHADTDASSPMEVASRKLLLLLLLPGTRSGDDADTEFYYANLQLHHMLVGIVQALAQRAAEEISGPQMLATMNATAMLWVARGDDSSYSVQNKVWVLAQCARGVAESDCVRCLHDSARAVDWDLGAGAGAGVGVVGAAVGVKCYLRFQVSTSELSPTDLLVAILFVLLVLRQVYPSDAASVPIIIVIFLTLFVAQKDYVLS